MLDGVWIHQDFDKSLKQSEADLLPFTYTLEFSMHQDSAELDASIKLVGFPAALNQKSSPPLKNTGMSSAWTGCANPFEDTYFK